MNQSVTYTVAIANLDAPVRDELSEMILPKGQTIYIVGSTSGGEGLIAVTTCAFCAEGVFVGWIATLSLDCVTVTRTATLGQLVEDGTVEEPISEAIEQAIAELTQQRS